MELSILVPTVGCQNKERRNTPISRRGDSARKAESEIARALCLTVQDLRSVGALLGLTAVAGVVARRL